MPMTSFRLCMHTCVYKTCFVYPSSVQSLGSQDEVNTDSMPREAVICIYQIQVVFSYVQTITKATVIQSAYCAFSWDLMYKLYVQLNAILPQNNVIMLFVISIKTVKNNCEFKYVQILAVLASEGYFYPIRQVIISNQHLFGIFVHHYSANYENFPALIDFVPAWHIKSDEADMHGQEQWDQQGLCGFCLVCDNGWNSYWCNPLYPHTCALTFSMLTMHGVIVV